MPTPGTENMCNGASRDVSASNPDRVMKQEVIFVVTVVFVMIFVLKVFQMFMYHNLQNALARSSALRNSDDVSELFSKVTKMIECTGDTIEAKRVSFVEHFGIVKVKSHVSADPPLLFTDLEWNDFVAIAKMEWILIFSFGIIALVFEAYVSCFALVFTTGSMVFQAAYRRRYPYEIKVWTDRYNTFIKATSLLVCSTIHIVFNQSTGWIFVYFHGRSAGFTIGVCVIFLVITNIYTYGKVYRLNDNSFTPLPMILVPMSCIPGSGLVHYGCKSHQVAPFPYFIMLITLLCVCTKKPTKNITSFIILIHAGWTFVILYALLNETCDADC